MKKTKKTKNTEKSGKKRPFLTFLLTLLILALLGGICVLSIDLAVRATADDYLLTLEEAAALQDVDCILVLGCKVHDSGDPSAMLHDRLIRGVELYDLGVAPKLLMSGDHGRTDYDEVDAMKQFAVDRGVPTADVFMDHAGFSTYESMYRAKEVFQTKKIVIVTQGYHLYRAIYNARKLGIEAYGVSADLRGYAGQTGRDLREILARNKDFFACIFQPEPTYLGDPIPIGGNGDLTNDENSNFTS